MSNECRLPNNTEQAPCLRYIAVEDLLLKSGALSTNEKHYLHIFGLSLSKTCPFTVTFTIKPCVNTDT